MARLHISLYLLIKFSKFGFGIVMFTICNGDNNFLIVNGPPGEGVVPPPAPIFSITEKGQNKYCYFFAGVKISDVVKWQP